MSATQSELRLARLIDERELVRGKHESKLAEIETREDKTLTASDAEQVKAYREKAADLDVEIRDLADEIKRNNDSIEESRSIRRLMAGGDPAIDVEDGNVVYRDFYSYARDAVLLHTSLGNMFADEAERNAMAGRQMLIQRTPANTLSSNVGGLNPPQHIAQIFQVINKSRDMVATALRVPLEKGSVTYPQVTTRPVVAVQNTEKTEAGNQGMVIDMETATASTYLGGGDISWQALNWSTPDALQLWFDLAAADYALKTETDAATVVSAAAFLNKISSTIGATPTFADFMTAVGAGAGKVYAQSGRIADTVYMAPDRFWYVFGTTSNAFAQFTTVTGNGVGPLKFVQSRGLNSGEIIVGDSQGLLVAETPGAPVELKVVEPSIGGVEVGIIGAFEAVVVDSGAFSEITTAS